MWETIGSDIPAAGCAAAAWGDEEIQVFVVRDDGQVWNTYWDGRAWHPWEAMGGSFTGRPAAAARDADRIDLLAVGRDGRVRHRWWDGSRWVPWREVDGAPDGAGAVECAWVGSTGLDVLVATNGGERRYVRVTP